MLSPKQLKAMKLAKGRPIGQFPVGSQPSDSTYFKNPYLPDQKQSYDAGGKYGRYDENGSNEYALAYNSRYNDNMNETWQNKIKKKSFNGGLDIAKPEGLPFASPARVKGIMDADKAYLKDIDGIEVYDGKKLINQAMKGKITPQDTLGMTKADRYNVEQGILLAEAKKMKGKKYIDPKIQAVSALLNETPYMKKLKASQLLTGK